MLVDAVEADWSLAMPCYYTRNLVLCQLRTPCCCHIPCDVYYLSEKGISGNVSIDVNGDRNADYSLLDMDPATGLFQVLLFFLFVTDCFLDK